MQYVIFGNCLFPLSILPRRFSLLVPWIKKCFCLLLSIIPWYRYPTVWLTINTPKSNSIVSNLGLLGIKQLWIFICRFFCELVFTDLGWMPKSKTTGSHGSPVFIFLFGFCCCCCCFHFLATQSSMQNLSSLQSWAWMSCHRAGSKLEGAQFSSRAIDLPTSEVTFFKDF